MVLPSSKQGLACFRWRKKGHLYENGVVKDAEKGLYPLMPNFSLDVGYHREITERAKGNGDIAGQTGPGRLHSGA